MKKGNYAFGFFFGLAIGFLLGILLTSKGGEQTQEDIKKLKARATRRLNQELKKHKNITEKQFQLIAHKIIDELDEYKDVSKESLLNLRTYLEDKWRSRT